MTDEQIKNFLNNFKSSYKYAFTSVDTQKEAAAMPPPPPPGMDPAAMGGAMPPPPPPGMDPAAMGGAMPPPPPEEQGPNPDEIVNMLEQFAKGMEAVEQKQAAMEQRMQQLESQISETLGRTSVILEILNKGEVSAPTVK